MPELRPVHRIRQGGIRITSVSCGDVRPAKVEMRKRGLHATPYTGSYDITPEVDEQIMYTRDRHMLDDVTIRAIPYFMTSNVNGETVYIASEL